MIYEFVEEFKDISVGDTVKIVRGCIPPCASGFIPVPPDFVQYIRLLANRFTVRTIQEIDDDSAMIGVDEVKGVLEYPQIKLYTGSTRMINSTKTQQGRACKIRV
jgi:hypothetical protein